MGYQTTAVVVAHEQTWRGRCLDERHDWRPGAGFGWYDCLRCGQVGVCVACHDPVIVAQWPASWGVRMRCPDHAANQADGVGGAA